MILNNFDMTYKTLGLEKLGKNCYKIIGQLSRFDVKYLYKILFVQEERHDLYDYFPGEKKAQEKRENIRKNDGLSELRAATLLKLCPRNISTMMAVDYSTSARDYLRRSDR